MYCNTTQRLNFIPIICQCISGRCSLDLFLAIYRRSPKYARPIAKTFLPPPFPTFLFLLCLEPFLNLSLFTILDFKIVSTDFFPPNPKTCSQYQGSNLISPDLLSCHNIAPCTVHPHPHFPLIMVHTRRSTLAQPSMAATHSANVSICIEF